MVGAAFAFVGFILTFFIKELPLRSRLPAPPPPEPRPATRDPVAADAEKPGERP
jgi:hypothetical protein